ncbi:uncharacterized protein LOC113505267 [Trichoplusia ni]|uniref:Uncharacterized protein LOC113505267 n=1 Tax=Trichoplusia ni TaxID=7111 RepID=A0A7E5WSX1_TRINI|nr:uncharacterized protein LOC113505267 [Trichoplusia ni]
MKVTVAFLLCVVACGEAIIYENASYSPEERQFLDFKLNNPKTIVWTKSSGDPVEIREVVAVNTDHFNNQLFVDTISSFSAERLPERITNAKGAGAFGYFVVTNDVSKYTYADLFNGIGKKTPLVARFSAVVQNKGGTDLGRESRGFAVKFYTKQGNLDLACLHIPVFLYRDPNFVSHLMHGVSRNPQTNLISSTSRWDVAIQRPATLNTLFWLYSDYGIPNGYRKADFFPVHTYELANKHGETHYVRFNFRTEQGFSAFTNQQAAEVSGRDPDYFVKDLFNAIGRGDYPSWRLEMDVLTKHDLQTVDYNPFDVTGLWTNGTFTTVQIGRLVLNKNVENVFRDLELAAFNPSNLVPGIPGPVDNLFKARRTAYRMAQNYRLGSNPNKILINMPLYARTYNRDGKPPVRGNMGNAPHYHPNSFNGPMPYVDENQPAKTLRVLGSMAVDFQPLTYFYNHIIESEAHRRRFISNLVDSLESVVPPVLDKVLELFDLIDHDLKRRVAVGLEAAYARRRADRGPPSINTPIRNFPTAVNY